MSSGPQSYYEEIENNLRESIKAKFQQLTTDQMVLIYEDLQALTLEPMTRAGHRKIDFILEALD